MHPCNDDVADVYIRLAQLDADWEEFPEERRYAFLRDWFVLSAERRAALIRSHPCGLGAVLRPSSWRSDMLYRDDVEMMQLVQNITTESGGQGRDGSYLPCCIVDSSCGEKCQDYYARDPARLKRVLDYLMGRGSDLFGEQGEPLSPSQFQCDGALAAWVGRAVRFRHRDVLEWCAETRVPLTPEARARLAVW